MPAWCWIVAAAVCFTLMGVTVKQSVKSYDINIFHLGFIRFALALIFVTAPAITGFWSLRVTNRKFFLLRGFFGAAGNFLLFAVIALIGLGKGTVLMQLLGVFGALSAMFILREKLSIRLMIAVFAAGAGVILCAGHRWPSAYEWLAVAGALCSGLALTFIRKLKDTDNLHVIFFSQSLCGFLLAMFALPFIGFPLSPAVWIGGLLITIFDIAGQYLMTHGMIRTPVAITGAILMLSPVLSLLIGLTVYREAMDVWQLAGCTLILTGSFFAMRKVQ